MKRMLERKDCIMRVGVLLRGATFIDHQSWLLIAALFWFYSKVFVDCALYDNLHGIPKESSAWNQ